MSLITDHTFTVRRQDGPFPKWDTRCSQCGSIREAHAEPPTAVPAELMEELQRDGQDLSIEQVRAVLDAIRTSGVRI